MEQLSILGVFGHFYISVSDLDYCIPNALGAVHDAMEVGGNINVEDSTSVALLTAVGPLLRLHSQTLAIGA